MPKKSEREIILGVTGSIAAYKAVQLASDLMGKNIAVTVIMTSNAIRFGHREVFASQILSIIGFAIVLIYSFDQIEHPIQSLFQILTLIIFPIYLFKLMLMKNKAKELAEMTNRKKRKVY